ncbi:hypothetical protein EMMF5_004273 [Cystobasidiomycetes sp. EMM_F5]
MKSAIIASVISAFAVSSIAALPTARDVGPSGVLNSPAGGTRIESSKIGNGGIWIDYSTVDEICGSSCDQTLALTLSISARLVQGDQTIILSNGEARNPKTGKINAFLKVPEGACGDFRLVVDEQQYYYGNVITFQSAAPAITIDCNASKP